MNVQELNKYVIKKLEGNRKKDEAFIDYLSDLLADYQDQVKNLDFGTISELQSGSIIDVVNGWCSGIIDSLNSYEEGNIVKAVEIIRQLFNQYAEQMSEFVINHEKNNIWYRMRTLEPYTRRYYAKDMFHVPFRKLGCLGNQRFSISGFPCLYLGNSVWSCWEEMHEPDMNNSCVSRIEAVGELKLLNLSWPVNDATVVDNIADYKAVCTWPLIIACSIRTLNPQDTFKPEYIIPQMVMMAIKTGSIYQGCTYTSTQRNDHFSWGYELLTNAAIPVMKIDHNYELCPELTSKFQITDSTKGEYLRLAGKISNGTFAGETFTMYVEGKYEESYFASIENEFCKNELLKAKPLDSAEFF